MLSSQLKPKSKILTHGYINTYSELNSQEKRQIYYKSLYKKENPLWDESMVYLSKILGSIDNNNLVLLDAGCGHGSYLVDENRSKISRALGVDISNESVSKNISLDEIKITDLEHLPYKDNYFDVVVSLWVIEHLKNPQVVFEEILRVLKKNGLFLFATPNKFYLPLFIAKIFSPLKINQFINKWLFGREKKDIYPTYYRGNTLNKIKMMCGSEFQINTLMFNFDPSYTSFNNLSFNISCWISRLIPKILSVFTCAHIIGVLKKQKSDSKRSRIGFLLI